MAKNLPTEIRTKFDFELKYLGADTLELAEIIIPSRKHVVLAILPGPDSTYRLDSQSRNAIHYSFQTL